mmetsp:Transcript_40070/g.128552  ORF Transcript_40070/g.128552 Transcript_40070/m.128552 type:complete len:115 (+) Transcript_40070:892-1236(+)
MGASESKRVRMKPSNARKSASGSLRASKVKRMRKKMKSNNLHPERTTALAPFFCVSKSLTRFSSTKIPRPVGLGLSAITPQPQAAKPQHPAPRKQPHCVARAPPIAATAAPKWG